MLILHDNTESGNAYKIRLLLTQLDKPFRSISYDVTKGETRTDDFLNRVSAIGRIPALEFEDGRVLCESNAILYFLALNTPFFPEDPFIQAEVIKWMFFEQYNHEPYIAVAKYILTMLNPDSNRREELPRLHEKGYQALDIMEQELQKKLFFVDNRYSIADIALFAYTHKAEMGEFDLKSYPNILAWMARIEGQEKFIKMM